MKHIHDLLIQKQAKMIMVEAIPEETKRINVKATRLRELGLSWKDL